MPVGELPEGVAVNPATNRVYVGSPSLDSVSVIDGTTNAVAAIVPLAAAPSGLAVNPSTNRIYATAGSSVVVIDGGTNTIAATVPLGSDAHGVAVNASANRIDAAVLGALKVIDGDTNTVIATVALDESSSNPQGVAVDATAARVYLALVNQGGVAVVDSATNTLVTTLLVADGPRRVAVNTDSGRVYVTNRATDNVSVIDGASNSIVATVSVGDRPYGVAVNPTTNRVYVANTGSDSVSVIDGGTDTVVATVTVGDGPHGIDVDPATNRVYVANSGSDSVSVINVGTNTVIATVPVGDEPHGVAVNPASNRVYVARPGPVGPGLWVIDGTSNSVIATVPAQGPHTGEVAVNSTTNRIYLTADGYVDDETGATLTVVDGTTNTVLSNGGPCLAWGVAVNWTANRVYVDCDTRPYHLAVVDGGTGTLVGGVDVGNVSDGVAVNPNTGRIYVANSWDGTLSVVDDSGEGALRQLEPAGATEDASYGLGVAAAAYVPAELVTHRSPACAVDRVPNGGSTGEASATRQAPSNARHSHAVDAALGSHECILGPRGYDDCLEGGGVVVDDPTCPEWSRVSDSQCITYGVYECGFWPGRMCYPIYVPAIRTDRCSSGYACPVQYMPYSSGTSCSGAGGVVETRLDNGCLLENECTFYEAVSLACEIAAVGGLAEVPDVAGTSAHEAGAPATPSDWSTGRSAALAAGLAVGVLVLAAGATYATRRWLRRRA